VTPNALTPPATTPEQPPTPTPQPPGADLRERILADFAVLRIPLSAAQLDAALAQAARDGCAHVEFLHRLITDQAGWRRQRSTERRIREARFAELKTLACFDWEFNAKAIKRVQIEDLATGDFIARRQNLVLAGHSGVGKSFLVQAIGQAACAKGYRVRYTTSAELLEDLAARLADRTLAERVRYYARFELLIIDEFGFDRLERSETPQAASLLYKIMDARSQKVSTAVVTNIDFDAWGEYLGDPPLAMAFLDRLVDGAIILKIKGKSYRAHRATQAAPAEAPAEQG
jgi:DNA replication protein DnaC